MIHDDWIEVEGKSEQDAIERACNVLNTNIEFLEYEKLDKSGRKLRARASDEPVREIEKEDEESEGDFVTSEEEDVFNLRTEEDFSEAREDEEDDDDFDQPLLEDTEMGLKAKEVLTVIVKGIAEESTVELFETKRKIQLEIKSPESAVFIGKYGHTLEAIQHVVSKALGFDQKNERMVVVDIEDYRTRKEESLETLARNLAKKARTEGRPIKAQPMGAMDRRVIHMALKGEPGVESKSIGEGLDRRVVVIPLNAKKRSNSNRDDRFERNDRGGNGNRPQRSGDREQSFRPREPRENREPRESSESREPRENRDHREEQNDSRPQRQSRFSSPQVDGEGQQENRESRPARAPRPQREHAPRQAKPVERAERQEEKTSQEHTESTTVKPEAFVPTRLPKRFQK